MDLGMPHMNGYDAARQIRQQPWGCQLMIIAPTGWGQDADKQRTKDTGFDYHLVKPADPSKLQLLLLQSVKTSFVVAGPSSDAAEPRAT